MGEVVKWYDQEAYKYRNKYDEHLQHLSNNKVFYNWTDSKYQEVLTRENAKMQKTISKNQASYQQFLSLNNRKTMALQRLASVRCRLGNGMCQASTPSCDALIAFYKNQADGIERIRHTTVGIIRDYMYSTSTVAQLDAAKAEAEENVKWNNEALRELIRDIKGDSYEEVSKRINWASRETLSENR